MNSIETITEFFGWCTVINIGIYLLTVASVTLFRNTAMRMNARMFAVSEEDVRHVTFQYIAHYKLAITVLCFVPYIALKVMQ